MKILQYSFVTLVGLGGGIAVGSGFVAFITVLDIIPRLSQISKSRFHVRKYEWALVLGALSLTLIDFFHTTIQIPRLFMICIGLFAGIFIGALAAGLTEVLNVFPILAKRLNMDRYIVIFLMAMVFGKMLGSLIQWFLKI